MREPDFVIYKEQRTSGGSLEMAVLEKVGNTLLQGGFVLLPSDTCYSLGALPISENSRTNVDGILKRNLGPVSLAFGSLPQVQEFVEVNEMIALLLARFTPGPITIVCKAREAIPEDFLKGTIGSPDRTIGVRIPDSFTERDIAATTQYPLMTVAVRDLETGAEIRDFDQALEIVRLGVERLGYPKWAAIENHSAFRAAHSTVIRVSGVDKITLIRQGQIAFEEIQNYVDSEGKHLLHAGALSRVVSGVRPSVPATTSSPPSEESSTKHREWFWNAFALGSVILSTFFFGGVFGAFWACAMIGIYLAPWFKGESRDQRFILKGIILTVVSFVVFAGWNWTNKFSGANPQTVAPSIAASPMATPTQTPLSRVTP